MTVSRRTVLMTACGLMALVGTRAFPAQPTPEAAKVLIESLTGEAIAALKDASMPPRARVERFRDLFKRYFAVEDAGRFVLGRHARQATPADYSEYLQLFEDLIIYGYAKRFSAYAGETLVIAGTQAAEGDSLTVLSVVESPGVAERLRVDWRISEIGGAMKISDVVVEGVSLRVTQRADFAATLKEKGGMAGLLAVLRQKVGALKAEMDAKG